MDTDQSAQKGSGGTQDEPAKKTKVKVSRKKITGKGTSRKKTQARGKSDKVAQPPTPAPEAPPEAPQHKAEVASPPPLPVTSPSPADPAGPPAEQPPSDAPVAEVARSSYSKVAPFDIPVEQMIPTGHRLRWRSIRQMGLKGPNGWMAVSWEQFLDWRDRLGLNIQAPLHEKHSPTSNVEYAGFVLMKLPLEEWDRRQARKRVMNKKRMQVTHDKRLGVDAKGSKVSITRRSR